MKIIIAPDSFKGSISADGAARAVAQGVKAALPDAEVLTLPVADGGEGTLKILVPRENRRKMTVSGTDGRSVSAEIGILGTSAVIEMAEAAGLCLVPEGERDPERSTTRGVGELVLAALDAGCREIMLTVGGSGSNDGGCGMMEALGARFYDKNGERIEDIRAMDMIRIGRIDLSAVDKRLYDTGITLACDVKNPILGKNGATYVYGPQKGADEAMLARLEAGMENYVRQIASLSKDMSAVQGTGAGGGIGFPLVSLFAARICSGIASVLDFYKFDEQLCDAELVITGEGKLDHQSAEGKAIAGVAHAAKAKNVKVLAIVGTTGEGYETIKSHGVTDIVALTDVTSDISYAISHADILLEAVAERYLKG